ncbi:predicted protein [Scheffersomyces stipitis CBS 6054]|uniref:Succinate dehydrogenase assembly factor 4, mitochondrial n=1 Tax=Scheffersomyces stipitis (strain ATCC 58785 / CBS 6054 / NBRC 10063 / NRRL Y-11545) TaxID=322104 RepID=A3LUM4_PICST|nr:predicted protein [Scheffersomyces stipitis CBS 6054]ABN66262.1 predicted protein [Scheffersomyces stipitis CBS 6054]KAG2733203.1 hypothetical protein G9P44_004193 [Scheffersomyces stipitis]
MLSRITARRWVGVSSRCSLSTRFYSSKLSTEYTPGPPRLPKEQQEEFERLQNIANSQIAIEEYNDQIRETGSANSDAVVPDQPVLKSDIGTFQVLKTIPEFEGEVNPKTGEIGGPKQDPLKHGDWSFNGRVTDF